MIEFLYGVPSSVVVCLVVLLTFRVRHRFRTVVGYRLVAQGMVMIALTRVSHPLFTVLIGHYHGAWITGVWFFLAWGQVYVGLRMHLDALGLMELYKSTGEETGGADED